MTAKEMKIKAFSLIEEYYPEKSGLAEDDDVKNKINGVINQIQMDLMALRKISAVKEIDIDETDDKEIDLLKRIDDLYQIKTIYFTDVVSYQMPNETTIILPDDYVGTFKVYYYKIPELMKLTFEDETASDEYDAKFIFDIDPVLLEIMPYGIAKDLLKMDMISNYGKYFQEEYMLRKNQLDTRLSSGQVIIEGGYDV